MLHCFNCGSDLPDNVIYCLHCGERLDTGEFETKLRTPTPAKKPMPTRKSLGLLWVKTIAAGVCLLILAAGVAVVGIVITAALSSGRSEVNTDTYTEARNSTRPNRSRATPQPENIETRKILNEAFTLAGGGYYYVSFALNSPGELRGGFRTTAGGAKDIDVYVVDENNFERFVNGQRFESFVMKLKAERGRLNTRLDAGRYRVIFSNRHAFLTAKEVAAEIDLLLQK